jgi:hypothetical protein
MELLRSTLYLNYLISDQQIGLYKLAYVLPLSQQFAVFAATNAEITDVFPAITPYASDSQGAISRFAGYNAAVRITGGTSGSGLLAGAGFLWNPSKQVGLGVIYGNCYSSRRHDSLSFRNFL